MSSQSRNELIRLLQNAYSGEKAAAYAYRGHALSVKNPQERQEIQKIEQEEWEHRRCLGEMLTSLGAQPRFTREVAMTLIGALIYCLCRLGGWFNLFNFGWFMGMYGAGKLEQSNISEYEVGARAAVACGELRFVEDLIEMAEVEWDHERYFRNKALTSKWVAVFSIWSSPLPRSSTRDGLKGSH